MNFGVRGRQPIFSARLVGLTATPIPETMAFFNNNHLYAPLVFADSFTPYRIDFEISATVVHPHPSGTSNGTFS